MPSRVTSALIVLAALATAHPAAADPVRVRTGIHPGFARVVFDWPKDVGFSLAQEQRQATITFARPIQVDLSGLANRLPAYLVAAKVGADGRSVRFTLNERLNIRTVRKGQSVGLDFIDAPATQTKPAQPAPATQKPVAPTKAAAQQPAPKPAEAAKAAKPTPPAQATAEAPPPAAPGKSAYDAPISVAEKPDFTRIVFPWPSTKYRLERRGKETVMVFERRLDPDLAVLRVEKPKGIVAASGKTANSLFGLHLKLAPGYTARTFTEGSSIVLDLVAPKPAAAAQAAAAKPAAEAKPKATPAAVPAEAAKPAAPVEAKAAPAAAPAQQAVPVLTGEKLGTGTRLGVTWPITVAAAVFERGGRLWIVLDDPRKVDFSGLPLDDLPGLGTMEQLADDHATVLRVPLKPGFGARVSGGSAGRKAGSAWLIDVVPQPVPPVSVDVVPEYHAVGGARVRIEAPGAQASLTIADPDAGDSLTVVPLPPGHGLARPRNFIECALLRAAQGIAIEPRIDGLEVRVSPDTVMIAAPGGLALSAPDPTLATDAALAPRQPAATEWQDEPAADFEVKRAALAQAEAVAPEAERSSRRLALARHYLHNNLAAEALGVLDMAVAEDPGIAAAGVYHAVRGQAEMLMGRAKEAEAELGFVDLAADPDALMWRAWALGQLTRWQDAAQTFQAAQMATLDQYSPRLRARFVLAAARAALETGDIDGARKQLALLPKGLPAMPASEAALLSGELAERSGDMQQALAAYARAAGIGGGAAAARATLRLALLQRKLGQITVAQTADRLEKLRYAWRGDATEAATMVALGDLYLAGGQYREGFAAYDEADRLYPDAPGADAVRARMKTAFSDLFLNGKADKMEPVKALGLFLDYRDLTPVGREGDDMIRKLADRLAAVDLLDQAEAVLDYQIKNRLEGVAKAQIAAKLAALALLNHEPERALAAIRETRQTALPDDLNQKRRMIEAQALMELGRNDDALEMIARFAGPDADGLRAEIHWRARDWAAAAKGMMAVLDARPKDGTLGQSDRQIVMKAAISYALAGDQAGLGSLRGRYRTAMQGSADADAFEVLTGPIDVEGVKFRELAAKIAGLDSLQGFLKNYKESL